MLMKTEKVLFKKLNVKETRDKKVDDDTKEVIENTDSKSDENAVIEQESVSREESSADEPLHLKPQETKRSYR